MKFRRRFRSFRPLRQPVIVRPVVGRRMAWRGGGGLIVGLLVGLCAILAFAVLVLPMLIGRGR